MSLRGCSSVWWNNSLNTSREFRTGFHLPTNSMVAIGDKVEIFCHAFYSVLPVTQEKLRKNPRDLSNKRKIRQGMFGDLCVTTLISVVNSLFQYLNMFDNLSTLKNILYFNILVCLIIYRRSKTFFFLLLFPKDKH